MSRRGQGRETAISLFSFQDIVTSVTAIMILLVLILSLELVTRVPGRQVLAQDRLAAAELRQSIADVKSRVGGVSLATQGLHQEAMETAAFDGDEIRSRISSARREAAADRSEARTLAVRCAETRREQREAERSLARTVDSTDIPTVADIDAVEQRTRDIEAVNQEEERRQEHERQRMASEPRKPSRLVFNPSPQDGRTPVLLEVSRDGLTGLDPSEGKAVHLGRSTAGGFFRSQALSRWLSSLDSSSQYVVVLLRPSGIDAYETVMSEVTEAGLSIGLELVGESMQVDVADPEEGS